MVKVIGLNSGSSFDGIDVVLVEIENGPGSDHVAFGARCFCKLVQPPRLAKL